MSDKLIHTGIIPPHDNELETAVLGSLMISPMSLIDVIDIIKPEIFYNEQNKQVFICILSLFEKGINPDLLVVMNESRILFPGALTPIYISKLTSRISSTQGVEYKVRILIELYLRRMIAQQSMHLGKSSYNQEFDIFDLLQNHEKQIQETVEYYTKSKTNKVSELLTQTIEDLEESSKNKDELSGIGSGFMELDRITNGWQKTDLIIIAARPSMGKTALIVSMAKNMAINFKKSVAIFSLEMSAQQLMKRLISVQCEVNVSSMVSGKVSDAEFLQIHNRIQPIAESEFFIDDTPALSILELKTKATRLKKQHNIELIMIDYLQLMRSGSDNNGNREQEISLISRSLKTLAKELNIPIIALAQLSRQVETRADKKPMLSDLRESGAIEQDADIVSFLYRPEYYGIIKDENGATTIGRAELIVSKHRSGALGTANLKFVSQYTKFDNISDLDKTYNNSSIKPNTSFEDYDEVPF